MVCNGAKEAGVFTVLVDETKDVSKKEQMSISLRYVDDKAITHDHCFTYVYAESVTAESITKYIVETLQSFQLDLNSIVSKGYDGASVMSGQCSGVQQRFNAVATNAIYVHCYAHTLNLVLVDSVMNVPVASEFVMNVPVASEFFSLVESLNILCQMSSKVAKRQS